MSRSEFLYIEIPYEMIYSISDTPLERIEVLTSLQGECIWYIGLLQDESVAFQAGLHFFLFSRFDTDSTRDAYFEGCKKFLKFFGFFTEECFSKIGDEARINGHVLEFEFLCHLTIEIASL